MLKTLLLRTSFLLALLPLSCASVFQGPILGRAVFERQSDAGDAMVYLRCRGPGIHGEIRTDDEQTRVRDDGGFTFIGSLTFPTTERCYLELRHPRYLGQRTELGDRLVERPEPLVLQSWDHFLDAGPSYTTNPGTRRPWPESEFRGHLSDVILWLQGFSATQQHEMARYVPDLHAIYRRVAAALGADNRSLGEFLQTIARIEDLTAYPFPFSAHRAAIREGDAATVRAFLLGGVLHQSPGDMYLAASAGQIEVMRVLRAHGDPVDGAGCAAPLVGALRASQWQAAHYLLREGASADNRCQDRRVLGDALGGFARAGYSAQVKAFIAAGAPADLRSTRNTTPLAEAVAAGRLETVKFLLAAGADPDAVTQEGVPLLEHAEAAGYLDIARALRLASSGPAAVKAAANQPGDYFPLPWRSRPGAASTAPIKFRWVNQLSADPIEPGVLWLATDGGLLRLVPATGELRAWTAETGLPSDKVRNLWHDPVEDYIWIATNGGLARIPPGAGDAVETVGKGGPFSSYASGFLGRDTDGSVWFVNGDGLYRLRVERGEGRHFAFARPIFGAAVIPDSANIYLTDDASLLRFSPATGKSVEVLDAQSLAPLVPEGPAGLPQLRSLTVDKARDGLWIGTFRHGVFRLDLTKGTLSRPALTAEQRASCARTTVTPHMHGQVAIAGGTVYIGLERCFGTLHSDNSYRVMRDRIDAGPVADTAGAIWYLAGKNLYRLAPDGDVDTFSSGRELP